MRNHELCFIRDTKYSLYSASTLAKIKQAQLYAVPTSPGKSKSTTHQHQHLLPRRLPLSQRDVSIFLWSSMTCATLDTLPATL
jgi:hypothetical protein